MESPPSIWEGRGCTASTHVRRLGSPTEASTPVVSRELFTPLARSLSEGWKLLE